MYAFVVCVTVRGLKHMTLCSILKMSFETLNYLRFWVCMCCVIVCARACVCLGVFYFLFVCLFVCVAEARHDPCSVGNKQFSQYLVPETLLTPTESFPECAIFHAPARSGAPHFSLCRGTYIPKCGGDVQPPPPFPGYFIYSSIQYFIVDLKNNAKEAELATTAL